MVADGAGPGCGTVSDVSIIGLVLAFLAGAAVAVIGCLIWFYRAFKDMPI
jgi:hypothetical protein